MAKEPPSHRRCESDEDSADQANEAIAAAQGRHQPITEVVQQGDSEGEVEAEELERLWEHGIEWPQKDRNQRVRIQIRDRNAKRIAQPVCPAQWKVPIRIATQECPADVVSVRIASEPVDIS